MTRRQPVPLPGALPAPRGGKWTITEFPGYGGVGGQTAPGAHIMRVPLGATDPERNIRKHEMLHAAFSKDTLPVHPEAAPEFVQVAEDARIQLLGQKIGIEWAPGGFESDAELDHIIKDTHQSISAPGLPAERLNFIKLCVARYGTPDFDRIRARLRRARKPALRTLQERLDRLICQHLVWISPQNPQSAINLAIALTRAFMPPPPPLPPPGPATPQDSNNPSASARTPTEQEQRTQLARKAARSAKYGSAPPRHQERIHPELPLWGRMKIERPPLTVPLRARLAAPQPRPATEGTLVRYPHRWAPDRAIFASRRRRVGGSVLIDCSGSMKLSPKDIRRIVTEAPAAVVALYSGTFQPESKGTLRIVAERGRCAADRWIASPSEGQNCIDGPALRWLATQRAPRLWISDGLVVGAGSDRSDAHHADVDRVCRTAHIRRIDKPDLAGDILAYVTRHANGNGV